MTENTYFSEAASSSSSRGNVSLTIFFTNNDLIIIIHLIGVYVIFLLWLLLDAVCGCLNPPVWYMLVGISNDLKHVV